MERESQMKVGDIDAMLYQWFVMAKLTELQGDKMMVDFGELSKKAPMTP